MEFIFLANTGVHADVINCTGALATVMRLVNNVMMIIYIAVPIILIIMGSIDLIKAILQSDDKKIKEAQSLLWKRLLYGALIFFLGVIIQFVVFEVIQPGGVSRACWRQTEELMTPGQP